MEKYYLTIGTVTKAMMARDALRRHGIEATAAKTPTGMTGRGCSYSVVVRGDPARAAELLAGENIKVTGVYRGRST